jgi:hypothetical protein
MTRPGHLRSFSMAQKWAFADVLSGGQAERRDIVPPPAMIDTPDGPKVFCFSNGELARIPTAILFEFPRITHCISRPTVNCGIMAISSICQVDVFPSSFKWGLASSAVQIEGGAASDGKGPSVWDTKAKTPGQIFDGSEPTVTNDSYHLSDQDVKLLKDIGVTAYRFSISWPRVIPKGESRSRGVRSWLNCSCCDQVDARTL